MVEELQFWQTGHYGPICKGLLKKRDGASSAVVVKTLRGTQLVYQRSETVWNVATCVGMLPLSICWSMRGLIVM